MEFLPWKIVEKDYEPEKNIYYETNFTLANGYMGLRGCLEEGFNKEMETYPGNYIAGVFDNFEGDYVEIVNCPDFISTNIWIGNSKLDMTQGWLRDYSRTLDMQEGTLTREFTWEDPEGNSTHFYFQRFLSMDNVHLSCLRIRLTPVNHQLPMKLETVLDGDVFNRKQRDYPPIKKIIPNYHFNTVKVEGFGKNGAYLESCTKTTGITLAQYVWLSPINNMKVDLELKEKKVIQTVIFEGEIDKEVGVDKYVATYTSRDAKTTELKALAGEEIVKAANNQYDILYNSHKLAWEKHWEIADIEIEGDTSSQQGIRFNIFNLIQANASWDAYVNLPAKLLSHTRYKGNAFWDTEMFMFPFYLFTNPQAARNLLMYRYNMLPAARENAKRRGLRGAMYPWMSAHDGSEQCDSWEYGDCEIHITADIAYALDQYVQTTKDIDFLENYATEIYIETARFWVERVAFNERLGKYTILTVKGPDEYCSIANNNMFTNYLAERNLELAIEAVEYLEQNSREKLIKLKNKLNLEIAEVEQWKKVSTNIYKNWDKSRELLIQDDAFMDYPEMDMEKYADRTMPLLEIIGYERVMRYRILRQADVLLLMYLLNDKFNKTQKLAAYNFYEPITTHDSSLSFNTHCIMAVELGMKEKAVDYFFKTCRLDLDDEQDTAASGLHGASLGGTWQAVVNGFGGLRVIEGQLHLSPIIPEKWKKLSFNIHFKGRLIGISITEKATEVKLISGEGIELFINRNRVKI